MNYQPEASTSWVVPSTAINVADGTLGPWSNPSSALIATGNGASITYDGVGNSHILSCAPAPAGTYALINDAAKINKMSVTCETKNTRYGTYYNTPSLFLMTNDAKYNTTQQSWPGGEGDWGSFTRNIDQSFYFPSGINGATWKNGKFGPGFQMRDSDSGEWGLHQLRNLQIIVYYQNPIPEDGSLLLCHA